MLVVADEAGYPFLETVDAALTMLCTRFDKGRDVALVQPNPDLVYLKSEGGSGIASGSAALVLEAALRLDYPQLPELHVVTLGKPNTGLFSEACEYIAISYPTFFTLQELLVAAVFIEDDRGVACFFAGVQKFWRVEIFPLSDNMTVDGIRECGRGEQQQQKSADNRTQPAHHW